MGRGHTVFRYLAVAAFLACYATILLGGNVIASDSGLGCPDWPTCHGTLLPHLAGATLVEYSHRIAAFVLSVLVAALVAVGAVAERGRPTVVRLAVGALATVVVEAILGGVVVESELVVAIVLVHFAVATVLFALLLLLALFANLPELPPGVRAWARRAMEERPEPPARPAGAAEAPDGRPDGIGAPARAEGWAELAR